MYVSLTGLTGFFTHLFSMSNQDKRNSHKSNHSNKREERAIRKAHQNNRRNKLSPTWNEVYSEQSYLSFKTQLTSLGLQLREIPGDGNCLFRALGDQLEGHSDNHLHHRSLTVSYMRNHRSDFEPFIEDNCNFNDHVEKLKQDGTYAGNDSIVAFARNNRVNVVIHQLNAPVWTISGCDHSSARQLHIAYHNGDHYSSVRKLYDDSKTASKVKLLTKTDKSSTSNKKYKNKASSNNVNKRQIEQISNITGCKDFKLIQQTLNENYFDENATISTLSQIKECIESSDSLNNIPKSNHLWENQGTGARIFGTANIKENNNTKINIPPQKKLSNKNRKEQQRKERKKRNLERKKTPTEISLSDSDENNSILIKNVESLNI